MKVNNLVQNIYKILKCISGDFEFNHILYVLKKEMFFQRKLENITIVSIANYVNLHSKQAHQLK
jgi:hypothetical protein